MLLQGQNLLCGGRAVAPRMGFKRGGGRCHGGPGEGAEGMELWLMVELVVEVGEERALEAEAQAVDEGEVSSLPLY